MKTPTIECPISLSNLPRSLLRNSIETSKVDQTFQADIDNFESKMFMPLFEMILYLFYLLKRLSKCVIELGWTGLQFLTSVIAHEGTIYSSNNLNNHGITSSPLLEDLTAGSPMMTAKFNEIIQTNTQPEDRRKSSLLSFLNGRPMIDIDAIIEKMAQELTDLIHQSVLSTNDQNRKNDSLESLSIKACQQFESKEDSPLPMVVNQNEKTLVTDSGDEVIQLRDRLDRFVFPPFFAPSK